MNDEWGSKKKKSRKEFKNLLQLNENENTVQ